MLQGKLLSLRIKRCRIRPMNINEASGADRAEAPGGPVFPQEDHRAALEAIKSRDFLDGQHSESARITSGIQKHLYGIASRISQLNTLGYLDTWQRAELHGLRGQERVLGVVLSDIGSISEAEDDDSQSPIEENGESATPSEVILFLDARIRALSEIRDKRRARNSGSNAETGRLNQILGEKEGLDSVKRFLNMDRSMRARTIAELTRQNETSSEDTSLE